MKNEKEMPVVETEVENVNAENIAENENEDVREERRDRKQIINNLLLEGCKRVSNLKIRNVTPTIMDEYIRLGLTLDKPVKGYVNKDGEYELSKTNVIFTSSYAVGALLRENEEVSFAVNDMIANPKLMAAILSCAKIDIIQEEVQEGDEYINPFSTKDEGTIMQHDTIINHVVDITLAPIGLRIMDKLIDKIVAV